VIPENLVLEGDRVCLEPLAHSHAADLHATCNDPALWEFTYQINPLGTFESTLASIDTARTLPDSRAFAIVDRSTGRTVGSTRYLDIDPINRKLEIGWTYLAQTHWRTSFNTECKLLLLRYAFETWGAVRVQLKAGSTNLRSQRAIERIGGTCEGTHRNFRIRPDGELRHATFFSVIASEWPATKARLEALLGYSTGKNAG
jgi:RimJ/RimL family protein N-acetyltransferase